jgi:hypothetical protein
MLYTTRFRLKESLLPKDMAEVNRLIDTKIIPAGTAVEGVRSVAGYQSITGELVLMLDIADLATVDRILADKGCQAVFGELYALTMRTGGEILFDRPAWQALYGKS